MPNFIVRPLARSGIEIIRVLHSARDADAQFYPCS